jgi:hypothetical protein
MKKKSQLVVCMSVVLICTACTKTPDSVKENSKSVSENTNGITSIQYISTDKLDDDIQNALDKSYSQFNLSDDINVELPEKYCESSFTQAEGFDEKYEAVFSRFFDKSTLADVSISQEESYDGMVSYSFGDSEKKVYGCVGNNGFIAFAKPSAYDNLFNGGNRIKIYHVDRNDDLSDSYNLDGTDVTVSQAVDFAQKWLDENYAEFEPDLDISVKTVIARQTDSGVFSYDIYAEKKYNGTPLDSLVQMFDSSSEDSVKMKYVTQNVYMQMFESDEIGSLTNGNGILNPKEGENLDEIVSLSSTLGYLENTFTDFNSTLEISDINLKYTLTPLNDYENGQSCYDAGIDFDSRLVWEFVIDVPEEDMPTGEEYSTAGNVQKFIYVDAENGDLDYEFDLNVLMQ